MEKRGFTLLELTIVIIVVGILAALAMPRFIQIAERARSAEAINALGVYKRAQIRYFTEHNSYDTSAACTRLK